MGIKTDWDRGYEAGHAQGLYDAKEQSSASPACSIADESGLDHLVARIRKAIENGTGCKITKDEVQNLLSSGGPGGQSKKAIVDALEAAHKHGWNGAVDAAVELISNGGGVDADHLYNELHSA